MRIVTKNKSHLFMISFFIGFAMHLLFNCGSAICRDTAVKVQGAVSLLNPQDVSISGLVGQGAEQSFLHAIKLNPRSLDAHWEYAYLLIRLVV